jgi:hypothetical protein
VQSARTEKQAPEGASLKPATKPSAPFDLPSNKTTELQLEVEKLAEAMIPGPPISRLGEAMPGWALGRPCSKC